MRKHILVNFTGRRGAFPLYALEMIKGFINNDVDVSAIISSNNTFIDDYKKLPLKNLCVIETYSNKFDFLINSIKFYIVTSKHIKKFFKNESINFIYCPGYTYWTHWINNLFPLIPKYITLHDPVPHSGESWFNRYISRKQEFETEKAYKIVILSKVFKKFVVDKYRRIEEDVLVIPHGIFSRYKDISTSKIKRTYFNNRYHLLFFGRIEHYKGIDILLDAYNYLFAKYNGRIDLTIAGNGDFSPYIEKYDENKNMRLINRWIDDAEVNSFFQGEKIILILPYLDATQSGIINIAMLNRNLIIASDTGGLREQLNDGKYGILFPVGDYKKLAHAIERVILNYSAYQSMIEEAYNSLEQLDWNVLAKRIIESFKW